MAKKKSKSVGKLTQEEKNLRERGRVYGASEDQIKDRIKINRERTRNQKRGNKKN